MIKIKMEVWIVTALLFMIISGVRTEGQTNDTKGVTNATGRITLSTAAYQKQYSDNNFQTTTTTTQKKSTTHMKQQDLPKEQFLDYNLRKIQSQYMEEKQRKLSEEHQDPEHEYLDEKQDEYVDDNELDEKEENEMLENEEDEFEEEEEEEEEDELGGGEEEEEEGFADNGAQRDQMKRDAMQMERLSHQEELFNALNLDESDHRFSDWSVNMDEEFEDMVRVLGEDDNLPLRELNPPVPENKRLRRSKYGENMFGVPLDAYEDEGF